MGGSPAEHIHRRVAEAFGLSPQEVREKSRRLMDLSKINRISPKEFWYRLGRRLSVKDVPLLRDVWLKEFRTASSIDEKVVSLIRNLGKYKLCLLCNVSNIYDHALDSQHDLLFDEIILSYKVGCKKPEARIYRIALIRLRLKPEECLIIDDQERNLVPARELGFATIKYKSFNSLVKALRSFSVEIETD